MEQTGVDESGVEPAAAAHLDDGERDHVRQQIGARPRGPVRARVPAPPRVSAHNGTRCARAMGVQSHLRMQITVTRVHRHIQKGAMSSGACAAAPNGHVATP